MLSTVFDKWAAMLLGGVLLFAIGIIVGHHAGVNAVEAKVEKAQLVQQGAVIKHDAAVATAAATQASDARAVGQDVQKQTEVIHEKIQRVYVKVPVYVPATVDAGCSINAGFSRLWNAANGVAGGELPAGADSGRQPVAAAEGAGVAGPAAASGVGPQ